MAYLNRRTFIERIGLGAGAWLLSPIVKTLVAQAQGTLGPRKRFIVMIQSNGFHYQSFAPVEFGGKAIFGKDLAQSTTYTMPKKFAPFATSFRNRMLLVDGLVNAQGKGGHTAGHVTLSCVPPLNAGDGPGGQSGGITIDQHIANVLGKTTPFRSVHLGAKTGSSDGKPDEQALISGWYARQRGESIPVQLLPSEAYTQLFANLPASSSSSSPSVDRKALFANKQKLLDFINDDVRRVRDRLSGAERAKLDEYLSAVEDAGKRLTSLSSAPAGPACNPQKVMNPGTPEDRFAAMVDIGTAAIACGLTNVLTLNFSGLGHAFKSMGLGESLHTVGHGGTDDSFGWHEKMTAFYATQLTRMLEKLNGIREGDKTIFDNSVLMMTSDAAEAHHCRTWRWPIALVGNAGGALKADGRYIRYPARSPSMKAAAVPVNIEPGQRCVGDLYSTLAHALGAPIDDFGKAGLEQVKGPLSELM